MTQLLGSIGAELTEPVMVQIMPLTALVPKMPFAVASVVALAQNTYSGV